uniref:F-box domain-containing protein n=1 Tax=Coccidioides posadasii RMSCC 3488 TaxID=454284 RepID=A0A0J6F888_COCPO|nr:hypothetical protein CPAG_02737 [Coccidioides posadasii RMSCC 3488]
MATRRTQLPNLPKEVLDQISSNLGYASCLALTLTCRELYAKVNLPTRPISDIYCHSKKPYAMTDLLEIEMWPVYNGAAFDDDHLKQATPNRDFFACYICLRLRSASEFSNAMMKGKRGKLGYSIVSERSKRFCMSCGVLYSLYQPGKPFQFGGSLLGTAWVCRGCHGLKTLTLWDMGSSSDGTCPDCGEKPPYLLERST